MPKPVSPMTTRSLSFVVKPKAGIGVQSVVLVVEPPIPPKEDATVRSGFRSSKPSSMFVPSKAARPAGFT